MRKKNNTQTYSVYNELPNISIILACHNEEQNIEKKIISTFNTNYPINKIEFLIGSDHSTDQTNNIIRSYSEKFSFIKFYEFQQRIGKIQIINCLKEKANSEILIFTDAKVFFRYETLFNLIKHFKNKDIDLVGGVLNNDKIESSGIYIQEDAYMNREMKIKYNEGIIYGASMGVFGALYAIRKEAFNAIPKNYNVDDFFVSMNVLKDGKKVIFTNDAIADETLTGNLNEEFRRKVRIATGNFQNLKHFFPILFYFWKPVSYIFISHKVIRWLGPFLLLFILISLSMLIEFNVYKYLLGGVIFIAVLSILEMILSLMKINIKNLRFITHFLTMNIALAVGFFKFVFGNKSGIWEPSKRN